MQCSKRIGPLLASGPDSRTELAEFRAKTANQSTLTYTSGTIVKLGIVWYSDVIIYECGYRKYHMNDYICIGVVWENVLRINVRIM
jgi:hypothetical protein